MGCSQRGLINRKKSSANKIEEGNDIGRKNGVSFLSDTNHFLNQINTKRTIKALNTVFPET